MAPDNYTIADQFALLAKLMDIHGENSFKAKSYASAAFNIEKLPMPLSTVAPDKLATLKGIGDSAAKKITEILQTGQLQALVDLLAKTPPGILEMMKIKGLGPKKIATIWKEMEIESIGELLYACNENRLLLFKGFGEKTQTNVKEAIEFFMKHQGSHLYAEIEGFARQVHETIRSRFPPFRLEMAGAIRRQLPVVERLDWITNIPAGELELYLIANGFEKKSQAEGVVTFAGAENIPLHFHIGETDNQFTRLLFETSCSEPFLKACKERKGYAQATGQPSETGYFSHLAAVALPPFLREDPASLELPETPDCIQPGDIKGIIHSHSTWSDGIASLEEMARACIDRGLEYLVISDHSKSAFYANGLSEERIREQHRLIDELNAKLQPFHIFKSIECDILNDGSLDYSDNVLATFDLVITSIHSNLKMPIEKAMQRLLRAIENPYTTILGHMTGRLLLSRPGYPVDHKAVIDHCAQYGVAIELNAHPRRLDIDWSWIPYAIEKGVMISIDPDAHAIEGFNDCYYGVLAAQKGGLEKSQNLSSLSLKEFSEYLKKKKE